MDDSPTWAQALRDQWASLLNTEDDDSQVRPKVETWYLNPRQHPVCRHSRIAMLTNHPALWKRELLAPWFAQADVSLPTQFALVMPTPLDADSTAHAQLICH